MSLTKEDLQAFANLINQQLDIKLQPIQNGLKIIQTEMGEMKSEIREMKSEIREIQTEIGEMKSEIREIQTEIGKMKSEIREIQTEIGKVQDEMTDVKSHLRIVEFKQDRTSKKLDDLQVDIKFAERDTRRDIHQLDDKVDTMLEVMREHELIPY